MKKNLFFLAFGLFLFKPLNAQLPAPNAIYTVQIVNSATCVGCCLGQLTISNYYHPCTLGSAAVFALISSTTNLSAIPYSNTTSWINLCNATYTLAAYHPNGIPPTCSSVGIFSVQVTYGTNIGINEEVMNGNSLFKLYPNPANDKLQIEKTNSINANLNYKTIAIYNQLGQLQREEEIEFKNEVASININYLTNGVYILSILTSEGFAIKKKLVIEH